MARVVDLSMEACIVGGIISRCIPNLDMHISIWTVVEIEMSAIQVCRPTLSPNLPDILSGYTSWFNSTTWMKLTPAPIFRNVQCEFIYARFYTRPNNPICTKKFRPSWLKTRKGVYICPQQHSVMFLVCIGIFIWSTHYHTSSNCYHAAIVKLRTKLV